MMTSSDLIRCKTNNALRGLGPLLKSWTGIVMDYCKSDDFEDTPWWYNERASLSTLAGAAWRIDGWQALEEFNTTKRNMEPDRKSTPAELKNGRCDLYVAHQTRGFAIEAKQAWQAMRTGHERMNDAMKKALNDAGNLTVDQADHRIAIVFTAPHIPLSQVAKNGQHIVDEDIVREKVTAWIKEANLDRFDALAYVFPTRCSKFVNEKWQLVYPGVVLSVMERKRGNKSARS